ncbi:MAG TPA: sulfotransferase [Acetobacteraceae bacterium]|nr:sulfotransferase [Acetobacteraceae bacterium]
MHSQPLWIIGAPRSGTTFLTAVLNRHPMISLTNESRVFVLLKHILERACTQPEFLDVDQRERFTGFLKREAAGLIERYYREELGVVTPIWGDKHPPYADPTVLSGRVGARPLLPVSGSCLPLIREVFPTSKFIHIHREPTEVAHSLERKGWTPSLADGMAVWRQYVREIDEFFAQIEPENRLVVAYADLLEDPDETAASLTGFLGLTDPQPIALFLHAQHSEPTPFSAPVRDLDAVYGTRVPLRLISEREAS